MISIPASRRPDFRQVLRPAWEPVLPVASPLVASLLIWLPELVPVLLSELVPVLAWELVPVLFSELVSKLEPLQVPAKGPFPGLVHERWSVGGPGPSR
jgi:hypothetical protein